MPSPTPTILRAGALATRSATASATATAKTRAFSTTRAVRGGGAPHYDPPTGWLFGVRPGEEYKREGWEIPFFYGICGSFAVATVAYAFKPDTRYVAFSLFSRWGGGDGEGGAG